MIRASWKYLVVGLVLVLMLTLVTSQANARWWGCYGWGGWGWNGWGGCAYSCYYSPCVSTCCDSGCYLGLRPGPIRRWVFGPYKWYGRGYSYGCCTDVCSYGCDVGCCNGAPTTGTHQPAQSAPASKEPTPAPPNPAAPLSPGMETGPAPAVPSTPVPPPAYTPPKTGATSADESGVLTVWVPYDAKVTVNGLATKSTGSRRQFVSYGLKPGLSYKYVVKAQVVRDGRIVEDTQTVILTAGQVTAVAFGFNASPEQVASAQ